MLRLGKKCRWQLSLEWKLQDLWLGVYWCWKTVYHGTAGVRTSELHIYVCLVPCVPLHLIIQVLA